MRWTFKVVNPSTKPLAKQLLDGWQLDTHVIWMQYMFYYTESNFYVVKKIVWYNKFSYLYIYLLTTI